MIVGIDLGTTHSLIGIYGPEGPRLIPNAHGELLTPSVVALDDEDHLRVGRPAREWLSTRPERSVAAFKRYMGSNRQHPLGARTFRPEELSALVLRSLLDDAQAHLGERPREAVISVPAYFSDGQRKATRTAGELAGLKVDRLVNEPTAAALAYGLQERKEESTFLVFDLGGGTFDVSILETFDGVMQVRATAGDNYLGGEDFTEILVLEACRRAGVSWGELDARQRGQLHARMERAKREIGGPTAPRVELEVHGRMLDWTLDEDEFARLADPLVQRLRQPVERALRDANLSLSTLDEVVLVGGASRMPVVSRLVARMLGRLPLRHVSPDEAIALGACVAAGMKARDQALEEIVLTDVSPYTLGLSISRADAGGRITHGHFSPLIERNTTVPTSREETYFPMQDWQQELLLEVYQGESPRVANNVRLGELSLKLPRKRREDNPVQVRFTYDVNGVLQVEAKDAEGRVFELILEKDPGSMDPSEIRDRLARLASLKVHPREAQPNLALVARAERIYEEHIGDARTWVQDGLAQFLAALETQDLALIERHRAEFSKMLDGIEAQLQ